MTESNAEKSVSVVARTPSLAAQAIACVVTVPTFKRPEQLLNTLHSLASQATERPFAVIVMENEAGERAGANAAAPLFADGTLNGLVIIAHKRGNCC
ncbi:MAG: glycosyltransferase family 2 protein, partial [Nitratireductor sp.]